MLKIRSFIIASYLIFFKNSYFVYNTLFVNNRRNFLKKTRKKKCAELLSEIAIENFVFK